MRSWGKCRKLCWLLFWPPCEGGVIWATPRGGEESRRKVNQFRGLFKAEGRNAVRSPELFRVGNAPWNYDDTRINGLPGWRRGYAWEPLGIFKIDHTEPAVNLAASSIFISARKTALKAPGSLTACLQAWNQIHIRCFLPHSVFRTLSTPNVVRSRSLRKKLSLFRSTKLLFQIVRNFYKILQWTKLFKKFLTSIIKCISMRVLDILSIKYII